MKETFYCETKLSSFNNNLCNKFIFFLSGSFRHCIIHFGLIKGDNVFCTPKNSMCTPNEICRTQLRFN